MRKLGHRSVSHSLKRYIKYKSAHSAPSADYKESGNKYNGNSGNSGNKRLYVFNNAPKPFSAVLHHPIFLEQTRLIKSFRFLLKKFFYGEYVGSHVIRFFGNGFIFVVCLLINFINFFSNGFYAEKVYRQRQKYGKGKPVIHIKKCYEHSYKSH